MLLSLMNFTDNLLQEYIRQIELDVFDKISIFTKNSVQDINDVLELQKQYCIVVKVKVLNHNNLNVLPYYKISVMVERPEDNKAVHIMQDGTKCCKYKDRWEVC